MREVGAANAFGLQIQVFNASTGPEIETAFATISRERADALFVAPDAFFSSRRVHLPSWRRATGFPRPIPLATMSMPAA